MDLTVRQTWEVSVEFQSPMVVAAEAEVADVSVEVEEEVLLMRLVVEAEVVLVSLLAQILQRPPGQVQS